MQGTRVRIPYKPEFFKLSFRNRKICVYSVTVMTFFYINSSPRSSNIWFSYIHNFNAKIWCRWKTKQYEYSTLLFTPFSYLFRKIMHGYDAHISQWTLIKSLCFILREFCFFKSETTEQKLKFSIYEPERDLDYICRKFTAARLNGWVSSLSVIANLKEESKTAWWVLATTLPTRSHDYFSSSYPNTIKFEKILRWSKSNSIFGPSGGKLAAFPRLLLRSSEDSIESFTSTKEATCG